LFQLIAHTFNGFSGKAALFFGNEAVDLFPTQDFEIRIGLEGKRANQSDLATIIAAAYKAEHSDNSKLIDASSWDSSVYHPVPTIVEAAESLFAGHKVEEITHAHAGDESLLATSNKLVQIIQGAQQRGEKVICFVTGIPGAGKTLIGLSLVHNPILRRDGSTGGVFLSGNKPLVSVVSAAIQRDQKRREKEGDAERVVGTRIQNIHTVIKDALSRSETPLDENIVVFDEAQRAWNAEKNFKKNKSEISEPETILSILNRRKDWTVLVALVGGGQEIHDGEAGLSEWGRVLREKYPDWKIFVSPKALEDDVNVPGNRLFADGNNGSLSILLDQSLHLNVNQRSFRAQQFTEWVNAVLACDSSKAAATIPDLQNFPFALTRSLATARAWLHKQTRGQQRCGLVASSGALRLRAEGLELSSGFRQGNRDMYVNWFLNLPPDVRSSNQLEVAASEFECQGLELDYVGVCWVGDLLFDTANKDWTFRNFSGSRWGLLRNEIDRQYLLNTYRVLLTRARRGLIIWVPEGDASDVTRHPSSFNPTAEFLISCGVPVI
jgi:hypothetical protein